MAIYWWTNTVQHIYVWWPTRTNQWPCPSGFHIPTKDEWQPLIEELTALWAYDVNNIKTYLKIPDAYYLARSSGAKETKYWTVRMWTSTMTANDVAWAWGIDQNLKLVFQEDKPANGFSIRPMKNEPVVPDSSWTVMKQGTWTAWIYWSSTLGLISLSSDWTTWYTISDKNLWATNVWDDGLYYQFGNDYWFVPNPSSSYKSLQNTTGYWPTNHYSDSHYVKISSNNRFSNTNNNIWGWDTWVARTEVSAVYQWTTQIYP